MIREKLAEHGVGAKTSFRWRGGEITRLEGFSDAVFAFVVTLLVVSLEVPQTFGELLIAMRGFFAFAICFIFLIFIWYNHYLFFRRYGLQDIVTIILSSALLFVVLFYVYPLKFLFTLFVNGLLGFDVEGMIQADQTWLLFVIYGGGFVAVFVVFALLYLHAYRKRDELELNEVEQFDTRSSIQANLINAGIGLLSVVIALVASPEYVGWAGWIYFLFTIVLTLNGWIRGTRRRQLEATVEKLQPGSIE